SLPGAQSLVRRGHVLQPGIPAGAPLYPVPRILRSLTTTAPTRDRSQSERAATASAIPRKYSSQSGLFMITPETGGASLRSPLPHLLQVDLFGCPNRVNLVLVPGRLVETTAGREGEVATFLNRDDSSVVLLPVVACGNDKQRRLFHQLSSLEISAVKRSP